MHSCSWTQNLDRNNLQMPHASNWQHTMVRMKPFCAIGKASRLFNGICLGCALVQDYDVSFCFVRRAFVMSRH